MTRPADPVFGVSEPHWAAQPGGPTPDVAGNRDAHSMEGDGSGTDVQWVNNELLAITSTIEQLQNRLEEANARLSSVREVETREFEIGRLFVEAQRFSEDALSKLEMQIHDVLCAAETKAIQILTEATEEAREIRREAQRAAFVSTQSVQELQSAIAGFTTVNSQLLKELGTLNGMLSPRGSTSAEIDPSADSGARSTYRD